MLPETFQNTSIYEVSQLVNEAGLLLNQHFSMVWVSGEISNLSLPKSGHVYFSLKDAKSQIKCALFSRYHQNSGLNLKEGMQVLIRANVSIYEARGDFQLIVQQIELMGEGRLRQAFEQLKMKLNQAGWFDSRHKKKLPRFPGCIGVITSVTGAAIRDVLAVLKRRFASIPVIIYPVLVQGELAARQIVSAIERANQRLECDVLLLCRGGGSIEDLWSFNEEMVAQAIFHSHLPIVTGIGHEIDFTIADFVADLRAPTPSGAAELIVPEALVLRKGIDQYAQRLTQAIQRKLVYTHQHLMHLKKRMQHPKTKLHTKAQALSELERRLFQAIQYQIHRKEVLLHQICRTWERHSPAGRLELLKQACRSMKEVLEQQIQYQLGMKHQRLEGLMHRLSAVSPLNTLKRGYAIALKQGIPLTRAASTQPGDKIEIKLAEGDLICQVLHEKNKRHPI